MADVPREGPTGGFGPHQRSWVTLTAGGMCQGTVLSTVHESTQSSHCSPRRWYPVCCWLVTQLCPTLCDPRTAAHRLSLSFTNSWSLLRLISIELGMPSSHLVLCHPVPRYHFHFTKGEGISTCPRSPTQ